jgi:hypothetical protein
MDTGHVEGSRTKTRQVTDLEEGRYQESRNRKIERMKVYVRLKVKQDSAREVTRQAGAAGVGQTLT